MKRLLLAAMLVGSISIGHSQETRSFLVAALNAPHSPVHGKGAANLGQALAVAAANDATLPPNSTSAGTLQSPVKEVREVLSRPPYYKAHPGGIEPLIVLTGFLTRPDSSTLTQRGRDPQNLLDRAGKPIADPSADPSANAFESDPNINFEKWDEYWRKTHGVRFTYTEDSSDVSMQSLARYDQIHRIPAGPTSLRPPPYTAPADEQSRLFPTVIGHVPEYRRPTWDGIAYLNFTSSGEIGKVFGDKFKTKIIPEDLVLFRQVASVLSRQYIRIPSLTGRDPITLVMTHVRRSGLSREEFQAQWLGKQARLVMSQPATRKLVRRYVQLQNIGPTEKGKPFYYEATANIDGITLMSFASMNDVEDFLMSDSYKAIVTGAHSIEASEKSEYWTGLNYSVINRINPERVTKR